MATSVLRKVATISGGLALAQAVTLAASPILTRIYPVEAFGEFGVYVAILSVCGVVGLLRFDQAVAISSSLADGVECFRVAIAISLALGGLVAALAAVVSLTDAPGSIREALWLLAPALTGSAMFTACQALALKLERVSAISKFFIGRAVGVACLQIALTAVNGNGLMLAQAAGFLLSGTLFAVWLYFTAPDLQRTPVRPLTETFLLNRDVVMLNTPHALLNSFSLNAPLLVIGSYFGSTVAGYYTLAERVLKAPIAMISNVVRQVLTNELVGSADPKTLVRRSTLALLLAGAAPFGAVLLLGPWLFAFVFGDAWVEAGIYAQLLALWMFAVLLNAPSMARLVQARRGRVFLGAQAIDLPVKIAAMWAVAYLSQEPRWAVATAGVVGPVYYLYLMNRATRQ